VRFFENGMLRKISGMGGMKEIGREEDYIYRGVL
jgi:hypothetical protein